MTPNNKPKQVKKHILVVNVTGKVPGKGIALLQTAYDSVYLKERLIEYLVRSLEALPDSSDILSVQKILHVQANKVPELMMTDANGNKIYDFESNQRVDELIALLAINGATNRLNINRAEKRILVPAWQRPNQNIIMKKFNGKESWDGFMHEYVQLGKEKPSIDMKIIPVEIKSLMINPAKEKYTDLNDLLDQKTPNFTKHFQSEGSVCAVVVLPYVMTSSQSTLPFDLKNASTTINKHVAPGALGCLLFFGFEDDGQNKTNIAVTCFFVSKKPKLGANGNIDNAELFRMQFGSFEHTISGNRKVS